MDTPIYAALAPGLIHPVARAWRSTASLETIALRDHQLPATSVPARLDGVDRSGAVIGGTGKIRLKVWLSHHGGRRPGLFPDIAIFANEFGELTRDHVPPKGSIDLKPVEIRNFAKWLTGRA